MSTKLDTLVVALKSVLGDRIAAIATDLGEVTVVVRSVDYAECARTLRDHPDLKFEQLIDLCGVDYSDYRNEPWEGPRFCVVVHLLSVTHNWRVRLKAFAPDDDLPALPSVNELWNAANWFER